jgi:diaminohydroxyphosphoribosylaminopyrimidine deaminase / 5-amino-6-(5-phosphoribosylamino)uracil reductase
MKSDESFISRCFELALNGIGSVSPNPLVGCVITNNGNIIGEGWHRKYGEAHAEVNAVQSVSDKTLLSSSTVYVNLEPCSHFGKTPPCADMLVEHNVKRVVISNLDSNKLVSGKGIEKLRGAGIEVVAGILEDEGRHLNRRFFTVMEKGRLYIILKWAQTVDGFISREVGERSQISNTYAKQLLHRWRTEEDAFLIGTQTAASDNPQLNVREWHGRNPIRVVFDRNLRLNRSLHLFDGLQPTICYNTMRSESKTNLDFVKVDGDFLPGVLKDLQQRKIQSVVVEGGTQTLQLFIDAGLWDEARVFTSPQKFGSGVSAPSVEGLEISKSNISGDSLTIYQNRSVAPMPVK